MPAQSSCKKRVSIFCAVKARKRATGIAAALLLLALLVFGKNISAAAEAYQTALQSQDVFAAQRSDSNDAYLLADFTFPGIPFMKDSAGLNEEYARKDASETKRKAYLGDADAMSRFGDMYFTGKNKNIKKNEKEALTWYKRAAEKGKYSAQMSLALIYAIGTETIKQDDAEALKWRMVSDPGRELNALYAIAGAFDCLSPTFWHINYEIDPWDAEKNEKNERAFFDKMSKDSASCRYLFDNLEIYPDDSTELAARWYKKAGEKGDLEAQKRLAAGYLRAYP